MSFSDTDAVHRYPSAVAALQQGDASAALAMTEHLSDPTALRLAGRALLVLGDRAGARRTLRAALEAARIAGHARGAALAHEALAFVARADGDPCEAVLHLEAALAAPSASGASRIVLHREAAILAYRCGDLAVAERHALRVLSDSASTEITAEDHARLGAILSEQGRHSCALVHLSRAADQLSSELESSHPAVLAMQAELAEALEAAGQLEAAERLHLTVMAGRDACPTTPPTEAASTLLALSALAARREDPAAARAWGLRAQMLLDGCVPADHPLLRDARQASVGD